ncbi:hypothetical protein DPMN_068457 [Dreissena polymorpha]|uniref:Uncharacterized protein n=1 Tax=Dreissena polymorpha TaxID=45954 RepID=A0A9D3YZ83_DREPO|nr:hypothetical protein DPMN_068457 [Dreissena polymorpha]
MRSVGTSRLAKEFLDSATGQYDELVYVNLKETSAMYVNICAQLTVSVQFHPNDVKSLESMLVCAVSTRKTQYVFFFDNGEYFIDNEAETREPLQNVFVALFKQNNIKVILTSTTKFQLESLRRIYHVCELQPLKPT